MRVEFYGIVRQRVGDPHCELDTVDGPLCLSEILRQLQQQYPALASDCLDDGRLRSGYVANLDGQRFVWEPTTPVRSGQTVLILSADVGG